MDEGEAAAPARPFDARRAALIGAGVLFVVGLNVAAYAVLTRPAVQEWLAGLVAVIYPGALLLAFVANVTVLIPIPYNGIMLAILGQAGLPWLAAICAAAGSVLGELSGYAAGRAGRRAVGESRAVRWATDRMQTSRAAFVFLVLFSAPPNPVFDMAGLAAGTMKVPLRVFLPAVFIGRCIRFLAFAYLGVR